MISLDHATAAALESERARTLLQNLTDEEYRVYVKPEGAYLRDSGPYPKSKPSDYAAGDAQELHELLMSASEVSALINMAASLGFGLHLVEISGDNQVVFGKRTPGSAFGDEVRVTARLC